MATQNRTMFGRFSPILVLLIVVELFNLIPVIRGDVTQRTNERCDKICKEESAKVAQVVDEN